MYKAARRLTGYLTKDDYARLDKIAKRIGPIKFSNRTHYNKTQTKFTPEQTYTNVVIEAEPLP